MIDKFTCTAKLIAKGFEREVKKLPNKIKTCTMMVMEDEVVSADTDGEQATSSSWSNDASSRDDSRSVSNPLSPPRSQGNNDELLDIAMINSQTPKRANISPEAISRPTGTGTGISKDSDSQSGQKGNDQREAEEDTNEAEDKSPNIAEDELLPLASEQPMSDGGSVSSVSAITFDCPNENTVNLDTKVAREKFIPLQTIKSIGNMECEENQENDIGGKENNYGHNKNTSKSDRLQAVYEKVTKLQKENAILNETNLKLVSQVTELQQMQERDKQNAMRLNTIHQKVLDIQSENDDLRRINRLLLDKVEQFEKLSLRTLPVSPHHEYLNRRRPASFAQQLPDTNAVDVLSQMPVSPSTEKELVILREKYYVTKKRLEEQKKVCRELLDDVNAFSSKKQDESQFFSHSEKGQGGDGHEKENDKKKSTGGLIVTRKFQRNDRKLNEAVKKMIEFENQSTEAIRELQERKMKHMEDLGVMAELESANTQQRLMLESLKRQVKEKDVAILNLESHIDAMNTDMIGMRTKQEREKQELHGAYEELKMEASQLVEWLKKQLAAKEKVEVNLQGTGYADEIALAQGDDDLESLTPSEKECLLREINDERQKLMAHLPASTRLLGYPQCTSSPEVTAKHPESVDASTLTPVSQA